MVQCEALIVVQGISHRRPQLELHTGPNGMKGSSGNFIFRVANSNADCIFFR